MKFSGWLHSLAQDLRYGLRLLRLNPGFTAIAVLSLALGTGANTAIFQLIDSLRLRTLPVAHPGQLANVRLLDRSWNSGRVHGRYADITSAQWGQIRDHQRVFSGMFAWATEGGFNLARGGEARYASGIWVSGDFFKTLEVPALQGRTLTADDDRRGCGSPPAVISYAFWQREYAGGPDILGRMISLEGHPLQGLRGRPSYKSARFVDVNSHEGTHFPFRNSFQIGSSLPLESPVSPAPKYRN